MSLPSKHEIVIGIVAPLGSNREHFIAKLKNTFESSNYIFEKISVLDELINTKPSSIPKTLDYFLKMQICSQLRFEYSNAILVTLIIKKIQETRKRIARNPKLNNAKGIIYLVDQLKNVGEHQALNYVYGLNYIQISLFSNQIERDNVLKTKFKNTIISNNIIDSYKAPCKKILKNMKIKLKTDNSDFINDLLSKFCDEILPDATHRLIEKDFNEIDNKFITSKSGQQISGLFHKSHYYINLDLHESDIDRETSKFINLLFGQNREYPTQDEFGMSLAFQASVRSNFPGDRHIGAAIISEYGEVISVASIRAPSQKSTNPTLDDRLAIQTGYNLFHDNIDQWKQFLEKLTSWYHPAMLSKNVTIESGIIYFKKQKKSLQYKVKDADGNIITGEILFSKLGIDTKSPITLEILKGLLPKLLKITTDRKHTFIDSNLLTIQSKNSLSDISRFIGGLLDFHPCTHAEISAIIDAAKLGVSVRNSTLYTTTFPCHLCAKDIINAGIKRVVYLEAYPKSKNKDLYPNLIAFDPKFESELIPFNFYWGIGHTRFIYAYSLNNTTDSANNPPPLIKYELPKYYKAKEDDVRDYLNNIIDKTPEQSLAH